MRRAWGGLKIDQQEYGQEMLANVAVWMYVVRSGLETVNALSVARKLHNVAGRPAWLSFALEFPKTKSISTVLSAYGPRCI